MQARDCILPCGERFQVGARPLPQRGAALGERTQFGKHGCSVAFALGSCPVDLSLLPSMARLSAADRGLVAVEALLAQGQQFARVGDCLQHALIEVLHGNAEVLVAFVESELALGLIGFPPVRLPVAFVGGGLALVGPLITQVSLVLALVCEPLALISVAVPFVSCALTSPQGPLVRELWTAMRDGGHVLGHLPSMHRLACAWP